MRADGALLRGAGVDDSDRRICVYLHLCDPRRADCLGDWLGSDPGVRVQQHERQRWLRGARGGIAGMDRDTFVPEVAVAGLPAAWAAGSAGQGHLRKRMARGIQHSRLPDCDAPDCGAGARHSGVGADQQHHGAGQDRGDSAVRLLRSELYSSGELHALLSERLVAACWLAVRSSFSRISDSIRSRRPARSADSPDAMSRSEFWRR